MSRIFYITTPIYYVNSHPHIGHAYTTIVGDIFRRFHRLFGEDTYFLTGTDEHGQKIAESAKKANISPQIFVDRISQEFQDLWPQLHIQYDQFIRTTNPDHKTRVQQVMQKIYDQGEIYFKQYEGLYCVGCERFMDESELTDGKCPDHQVEPRLHQEGNYFFKMSAYQDWLIREVETKEDWIYPKRYRTEVLKFLKNPLQDLCISRPKNRLTWGIELPFDANFVTYVWFDALLNYSNALGWPDEELYLKYWPRVHHLIGKDILKTHAVYWPCMLKAGGLPMFKKLVVNGFWISSGSKMSKSIGNVVDPLAMKDRVGTDPLRYFLARDMVYGQDANFTEELLLARYNGDLANNIGNLINRSISMSRRNFDNRIPPKGELEDLEKELHSRFARGTALVQQLVLGFQLNRALEQVALMSSQVNKYIDSTTPWKLAKEANHARLGTVLYTALDAVRILMQLLFPVMPEKMKTAWQALGLAEDTLDHAQFEIGLLPEGLLLPEPSPLFPKIKEVSSENTPHTSSVPTHSGKSVAAPNEVTIEEFSKIELKVGRIVLCQSVKESDKLLHSQVDVGEGRLRSIVSGIAESYKPDSLVGRQVVVVCNLKSAKMRGVISEGMILCTENDGHYFLVEPPAEAAPGTLIR